MSGLNEGYLSDRLGAEAYQRIFASGLAALSSELPWFPDNAIVPGMRADPSIWEEGAGCAAAHILPGVMVTPIRFWERQKEQYWTPRALFRPYWSGPMRVQRVNDPMPNVAVWRQASAIEILCAVAQNPQVGSLRTADPCWASGEMPYFYSWENDSGFSSRNSVQAYYMPEREQVVLDWDRSDPFHHRTYVRRKSSGDPYPYKECAKVALD